MKLSIITCTYNSEKYLQECINSVIAQNLDTEIYEHIFVDAYSTDDTNKIIKKYMEKYPNVKVIERKPKGVYNAMNEGIKEAKGEYILCLNSDDYLEKNVLSGYLNYIKETGERDLYYAQIHIIQQNGSKYVMPVKNKILHKFLKVILSNYIISHPGVLVKNRTFLELGYFDETKKIASDFGMWLKFMKYKKTIQFYPFVVSNFVEHGNNLSSNTKLLQEECHYFRKKYYGLRGILIDFLLTIRLKIKRLIDKIFN